MTISLTDRINILGDKIVKCDAACKGIKLCRKNGVKNYKSISDGWETRYGTKDKPNGEKRRLGKEHRYYTQLRKLFRDVFNGDILWTELVHCESVDRKGKNEPLPAATKRTCISRHLVKEIEEVPNKWPLIAVGREAYGALQYLFLNRTVIGVPHPTGSHGVFDGLLKSVDADRDKLRHKLEKHRHLPVWLPDLFK